MVSRLGVCTLYVDVCPGMVLQPGTNQFSSHDRSLGAYSWPWLAHFVICRIMVIQHAQDPILTRNFFSKMTLHWFWLMTLLSNSFPHSLYPSLMASSNQTKPCEIWKMYDVFWRNVFGKIYYCFYHLPLLY